MRMWNVDPEKMCDKHLLGEHVEMHMFVGCVKHGKSLNGYIRKRLVDPSNVEKRHDELATEMIRRNMCHQSPISKGVIAFDVSDDCKISAVRSEEELRKRCLRCRKRIELDSEGGKR